MHDRADLFTLLYLLCLYNIFTSRHNISYHDFICPGMTQSTIFVAAFVSFLLLNVFENVVHYSIGRSYKKHYMFVLPNMYDFTRLSLVMIVFAVLQGILTNVINGTE